MRREQIFTSWLVNSRSADERQRLQQWLADQIDLDRQWADEILTYPNGVEHVESVPHRLGDYFASIRLLPGVPPTDLTFRLVFERLPDAARYWKDLMVRILRDTQKAAADARITVDYKGDEEPAVTVASR